MTPKIAHILNHPVALASVTHAELKTVFDKFKKFVKKLAQTGIISLVNNSDNSAKITFIYIDREYDIQFSSGYENRVFMGKITAYRKIENAVFEIGSISFDSRKARIIEPLTQAEGSLHETLFCKTVLYAWLLKETGWDFTQLSQQLNELNEPNVLPKSDV